MNKGDIFSVPQLSDASPYLNVDGQQLQHGISDAAYEAIPSQLLPLLRTDSIGSVSNNGQMVIQFTGDDGHQFMPNPVFLQSGELDQREHQLPVWRDFHFYQYRNSSPSLLPYHFAAVSLFFALLRLCVYQSVSTQRANSHNKSPRRFRKIIISGFLSSSPDFFQIADATFQRGGKWSVPCRGPGGIFSRAPGGGFPAFGKLTFCASISFTSFSSCAVMSAVTRAKPSLA